MKKILSVVTLLFSCSLAFSQITITSTITAPTCSGYGNGSATITTTGGNAPYTYTLASAPFTTNSTGVFSGLAVGNYALIVEDASANTSSTTIIVTEPTPLMTSISSQTNISCFGLCNGAFNIQASGGTPIYTYVTSFGSVVPTNSNVCAGVHSYTVADSNGCLSSGTVTITQPTQLAPGVYTSTNCVGPATLSVLGIGGVPTYSYNLNGTAYQSSGIFQVPTGTYTVGTIDANGCIASNTIQIVQPSTYVSLSITSQSNIACFGTCSGQVQVTASGGTPPYTYYTQSMVPQSSSTLSNLCAGTHTLYVSDANNCQHVITTYITQPTQLIASITSTNATCGQSDGSLCATINGGTLPYAIIWNSASTSICNNNIPAGAYSYTVTDAQGCQNSANKIISSTGGPVVSIASQTNVSCFGGSNGAANVNIIGGTAPYTYSWTTGSTFSNLSGVASGVYNVITTDATGCVGTTSVVITQPSQLLVYAYSQPECGGGMCNGSINAYVNGGTSPYLYTWSTGATTANYLPGLCAGMYSVQVTDAMGCVGTQTALVNQTLPITITPSYNNASCGGACDGSAYMTVSGGNPVYYYTWAPSLPNSAFANNLCPGSYTFVVTDVSGCSATNTFTISNSGLNSISNVTLSTLAIKETCLNSADGSIDLMVTGTNSGPFTYHWNNGASSQDVFNLNSNIYSVTVFDAAMNCLTIQDTITADGTNCGVITGNVFIDNNSDCVINSGDINFNSALIVVNPGNRYGYTNAAGGYTVANLPYGNYSTSLVYSNGVLIPTPTCSTSITATLNSGTPLSSNNDFSIGYNSNSQPDMQVWGYSSPVVPGFVAHLTYQLTNVNNVNGTGLFKVVLPNIFTPNITSVSPNTYTLSGDTIIWNFNNITFTSGGAWFGIDFYVPVGTTLGSLFSTCMYAQPNITDLNYASNNYCYSTTITGSFDPNDKTVSPVGVGPNGDIAATETDLTYLIRFQNTGNGPAVNIVVKDTLSPNVDINTFEMLSASHNYNIDILSGNILRWKFNNIMLADSGSNEPASHGYIQYRIKRNNNNAPGTQIKNTAYIYFDFNEPVVTNTAINTIETVTGIKSSFKNSEEWNVYPNPSTGVLYVVNSSTVKEASQIQVINSIGQTVLEETITSNYKNIDLSKLNNGVYFVKIVSDRQSVIKRVVLSK